MSNSGLHTHIPYTKHTNTHTHAHTHVWIYLCMCINGYVGEGIEENVIKLTKNVYQNFRLSVVSLATQNLVSHRLI